MAKGEMPKLFNSFIQSWNVIFFLIVAAGGIYMLYTGYSYIWGAVLLVVGIGGTVFCARMAHTIMNYDGQVETGFDKWEKQRQAAKLKKAAEAAKKAEQKE